MDQKSLGIVRTVVWSLVVVAVAFAVWMMPRTPASESRPARIALVTADGDPYWDVVILGAQEAAKRSNARLDVFKASGTSADQTKLLSNLAGYDAIAVSPVDGTRQGVLLRELARQMHLVTIDSDSNASGRLCFVGTDNYTAGRKCGRLIKQALPEGGTIAIATGPLDKENGRDRRQGIIDELLDRDFFGGRLNDPIEGVIGEGAYRIVATAIDETTPESAKANAAALLAAHEDLDLIVGIYAYNAPAAVAAINEAQRVGDVRVIGFDVDGATLAGIEAGIVFGTVAQDQFNYGYDAVRVLTDVVMADSGFNLPLDRQIHFPVVLVTADNLDEFKISRRGSLMGLWAPIQSSQPREAEIDPALEAELNAGGRQAAPQPE